MKKNTKAMLTFLAATSITSVAGITSYANTKYIDTNVSAKQFNDAIEARIKEANQVQNEEEKIETGVDTQVSTPEVEEASTNEVEVQKEEIIENVKTATTDSEVDFEKVNAVIEDVFVAEDSEAVVSSGFIVASNPRIIDTAAVSTDEVSSIGVRAKKNSERSTSDSNLLDGPDNTPAETYAAPIFSTGKLIISGSSGNNSIVTESGNVTSNVGTSNSERSEENSGEKTEEERKQDVADTEGDTEVSESNEELRNRVAAYAASFANGVGKYRYGGINPFTGADCSGFVQHVLAKAAGVHISRTSASQAGNGQRVASIDQAKVGDLLFYAKGGRVNHVGMYLGNGKVISASSPSTGMRITAYNYRPVVGIRNVLGN